MTPTRLPFLLLSALLVTGCTTTAPAPRAAAPAPARELPPASIVGCEEKSAMLDNFTAFVAAVDGVPAGGGRQGWNTPVALAPGPRHLTLSFNRGVFAAQTEVDLVAASAASYQVRFATDAQFLGGNSYCEFWIVDTTTGAPITGRVRAPLRKSETAAAD